jgi:hypothetical protein
MKPISSRGKTPFSNSFKRRLDGSGKEIGLAICAVFIAVAIGYDSGLTPAHSAGLTRSADLNGDGKVDVRDLSMLIASWGTPTGDITGDGTTDITDLSRFLSTWSTTSSPAPLQTGGASGTPIISPVPPVSPSGEGMPIGDLPGWKQTVAEDFTTTAPAGLGANGFKQVYVANWCGYNEGQSGYYNNEVISAHDGVMDFTLDGVKGAAGAFGSNGTCGQLYGRFSMRFKAVNAGSYGTAIMVWPNNNTWGNGEVDYPEGNFDTNFNINQHGINCTNCSANIATLKTGATFATWHTATTEWLPTGVKYYLDGALIKTVSTSVPVNNHRYTIQMAPTHTPVTSGHFLIDWVSIYAPK